MTARDDLAATIYACAPPMKVQPGTYHAMADVIIAAGWRAPVEVASIEAAAIREYRDALEDNRGCAEVWGFDDYLHDLEDWAIEIEIDAAASAASRTDAEAKLDRLTREEACDRDVVLQADAYEREPLDGRGTE